MPSGRSRWQSRRPSSTARRGQRRTHDRHRHAHHTFSRRRTAHGVPQADTRGHVPRSSVDWSGAVKALDIAVQVGDAVTDLDVLANLANTALQLGDDAAQQHFYTLCLSRAREAGA